MKKIIGIIGVFMIAGVMFLAGNTNNEANQTDLASLLSLSTANAESGSAGCRNTGYSGDFCIKDGLRYPGCVNNSLGAGCF